MNQHADRQATPRCPICRLLRWLRLADYEDAKREGTLRTIEEVGRD